MSWPYGAPFDVQPNVAGYRNQAIVHNYCTLEEHTVPAVPAFASHHGFSPNSTDALATNIGVPQGRCFVQNNPIGLHGHHIVPPNLVNTNIGVATINTPPPIHCVLQNTSALPSSVREVKIKLPTPDGSGSVKYPAPDPSSLIFDPALGYRYDAVTGLHYDANSGYFFNSDKEMFLSWDFFKQTYLRVENPLVTFPILGNRKKKFDSQRKIESTHSESKDRSEKRSKKRKSSSSERDDGQRKNQQRSRSPPPHRAVRSSRSSSRRGSRSISPSSNTRSVIAASSGRERDVQKRSKNPDNDKRRRKSPQRRRSRTKKSSSSPSPPKRTLNRNRSRSPGNNKRRSVSRSLRKRRSRSRSRSSGPSSRRKDCQTRRYQAGNSDERQRRGTSCDSSGSSFPEVSKGSKNTKKTKTAHDSSGIPDVLGNVGNGEGEEMTEELLDLLLVDNDSNYMNQNGESVFKREDVHEKDSSCPTNERHAPQGEKMNSAIGRAYDSPIKSEEVSANRVPGDTDPLSDLYDRIPTCFVHVKSPIQGFQANIVTPSLEHHLFTFQISYLKIRIRAKNDFGCPFECLQVEFKATVAAINWFLKTKRKITLQFTKEKKEDFFLYYCKAPWKCKNCPNHLPNIFFRSLCYLCYCHKSGSLTSVKFSDVPTRFLGCCEMPYSTNGSNVMERLPSIIQASDLKRVWIVEDPGMKCCSGLVVVEMADTEEAENVYRRAFTNPESRHVLKFVNEDSNRSNVVFPRWEDNIPLVQPAEPPSCQLLLNAHIKTNREGDAKLHDVESDKGKVDPNLGTQGSTTGVSYNRVPGDTDVLSDLYDEIPSSVVHVKSPNQGFQEKIIKQSLELHLLTNGFKNVSILIVPQNVMGSPFEFIEVTFDFATRAKRWFQETNRKITLQHTQGMEVDYFLYYCRAPPWRCIRCPEKSTNIFFRSLCHSCYCHKSGYFTNIKFSDVPTKFLACCRMPYSIDKSNVMQQLPGIIQNSNYKSVGIAEDPGMKFCCGVVVVEMPDIGEATNIYLKDPKNLENRPILKYFDEDSARSSVTFIPRDQNMQLSNLSDNPVHGDTDAFSKLYPSEPSRFVHVKSTHNTSEIYSLRVTKGSLEQHLTSYKIAFLKVVSKGRNDCGCPYSYLQVEFKSTTDAKRWFQVTNRKITLENACGRKVDCFLYYCQKNWLCRFCKLVNFFLRSLCFKCHRPKDGCRAPFEWSKAPTRFLGCVRFLCDTNDRNVMDRLPIGLRQVDMKLVWIVEDPGLKCCSGLVVLEMHDIEEAMSVYSRESMEPANRNRLRFVTPLSYDDKSTNHIGLEKVVEHHGSPLDGISRPVEQSQKDPDTQTNRKDSKLQDVKCNEEEQSRLKHNISNNRVPGDTDPLSDLYNGVPTNLVHLKSPTHGFDESIIQKSLKQHLLDNGIKYSHIKVIAKNSDGCPFECLQVALESVTSAKQWFLKTGRKITLQFDQHKVVEYFLYYCWTPSWYCAFCTERAVNVFFRSLCHNCFRHKKRYSDSFKFSDAPTRFLAYCRTPYVTDKSNVIQQLPKGIRESNFKSVGIVEDPDMQCCSGVVILEMSDIEEAMHLRQSLSLPSLELRYVDLVNFKVNLQPHSKSLPLPAAPVSVSLPLLPTPVRGSLPLLPKPVRESPPSLMSVPIRKLSPSRQSTPVRRSHPLLSSIRF